MSFRNLRRARRSAWAGLGDQAGLGTVGPRLPQRRRRALGIGRRVLVVNRESAAGELAHPLFELVQQGRVAVGDVAALAGVSSEVVQASAVAAVGGHVCPMLAA